MMRRGKPVDHVDIKVVLLGKAFAGKTCLVQRYIHQTYNDTPYSNTIGAAFASKKLISKGKHVVMNVWDTAGSERYQSMSKIYYRGARAAILCYDLTDKTSFEKVRFWVGELQTNEENCRMYLCGTKKDLIDDDPESRAVSLSVVQSLAQDLQSDIYETSSVTGETIDEMFDKIAADYVINMKNIPPTTENGADESVILNEYSPPVHRWRCSQC
ncbi:ras-related protein Rab-24-like [Mizuhopecten yessoensis]|uniref:Ras-related protein Rab-24 n=1 Tax=Mizuhopecten yessoensis TaxID=6573 RepID=A0A210PPL2_MIZYE|nr:ras-related protein Rab-24-like [Mizuhopecten yessoensis]OWF38440.1 Ras-related protein Rab-24 [Mizuhopecten yessoensis]